MPVMLIIPLSNRNQEIITEARSLQTLGPLKESWKVNYDRFNEESIHWPGLIDV